MFRFEGLQIWQRACDVGSDLCDVAATLESKRPYRFAEQLRAAALSISNNIAETPVVFFRHLLFLVKTTLENAPALCTNLVFPGFLNPLSEQRDVLLKELDELTRMIQSFKFPPKLPAPSTPVFPIS